MSMRSDVLRALTAIPPFPSLAGEILRGLQYENGSLRRIVALVEKDVAITTAVLRLANSGYYGRRRAVPSVQTALQVLGTDVFAETVVQVSVRAYAERGMPPEDLNRCWAHSMACAEISRILAIAAGLPADAAHSAGLLHDLGRFGLALAAPAVHTQYLNGPPREDALAEEHAQFGVDHTEAGRLMSERFHLPAEIQAAAGRHHDQFSGQSADILAVVKTACRIANTIGFQVLPSAYRATLDEIIADSPAGLRAHIAPDPSFWVGILLPAQGAA